MENIRLQKFLAQAEVASRRGAEELIANGHVTVNGKRASLGDKVNSKDVVMVRDKRIIPQKGNVYIMLHKPRGYVTTMRDELGRKCVDHLMGGLNERVFPVGRLDKDSEGLLLMTNDGGWANKVTHPSGNVFKTYRVTVGAPATDAQLDKLSAGVMIDGRPTKEALVTVESQQNDRVVLKIVIGEGRNRQIRNMCEQVGLNVKRLKRTKIGALSLGMLPPGKWRELNEKEVGLVFK